MGIFSLFGKREGPATPAPRERARAPQRAPAPSPQVVQREAALATSMKIDAIEFEMSSEFVSTALPRGVRHNPAAGNTPAKAPPIRSSQSLRDTIIKALPHGGVPMGPSTAFLFDGESIAKTLALSASETTPAIDEAAILFSLGEMATVEELLQTAIQDPALGDDARIAWAMLLDLYQVMRQREQFDELSIAYANRFETSPPAWIELAGRSLTDGVADADLPSIIAFAGKLDSSILPQLEQLQHLASDKHTVRLEFTRVSEVHPVGCGLLLRGLNKLQTGGHDLVLVGALELAGKIRQMLQVGRRDETAAPWLLLLEIYRLLNMEQAFEDSSIDYCITFEVSPPAFAAPDNMIIAEAPEIRDESEMAEQFMLPAEIAENSDVLMAQIDDYVAWHNPSVLNCSRLIRVDFNAASQLMNHLEPLVRHGSVIRMLAVSHLVAALFRVAGMHEIVHIQTRKI